MNKLCVLTLAIAVSFSLTLLIAEMNYRIQDGPVATPIESGPPKSEAAPVVAGRPQPVAPRVDPLRPFLNALMQVESGGDCQAVGDGGRSRGPYQIGVAYWEDAGLREIDYHVWVNDPSACERVMFAYWNRYARKALSELDFETLARVHNGGPRGAGKESTKPYWRRVEAAMEQEK